MRNVLFALAIGFGLAASALLALTFSSTPGNAQAQKNPIAGVRTCSEANEKICLSYCRSIGSGPDSACIADCKNFQIQCLRTGDYESRLYLQRGLQKR